LFAVLRRRAAVFRHLIAIGGNRDMAGRRIRLESLDPAGRNGRRSRDLSRRNLRGQGERYGGAGFNPFGDDHMRRMTGTGPQDHPAGRIVAEFSFRRFLRVASLAALRFAECGFAATVRGEINPMRVRSPVHRRGRHMSAASSSRAPASAATTRRINRLAAVQNPFPPLLSQDVRFSPDIHDWWVPPLNRLWMSIEYRRKIFEWVEFVEKLVAKRSDIGRLCMLRFHSRLRLARNAPERG
jgi:hypothetical protein